MSIKNFYYKVQETSTTTGDAGLTLEGNTTTNLRFLDTVGSDKDFTYKIVNDDNTLEWEIGVGYIDDSSVAAGVLVRSQVISSSDGNTAVAFTAGTKTIDMVATDSNIVNSDTISSNATLQFTTASYIVDASAGNVELTLPAIAEGFDSTSNNQAVLISVVLNNTTGGATEQANAITITPDATDTVGGNANYVLSILNDFVQILADPGNNNWVVLDPIQDSVYPSGGDGAIQFAQNQGFAYNSGLYWDIANSAFVVGDNTKADASVSIDISGVATFNNQNNNADFTIKTQNADNTFFVDASSDRIGVGNSSPSYKVDVAISGNDGVSISTSQAASVPQIKISNNYTGLLVGDDIGSVVFNALNSSDVSTDYAKILVEFLSDNAGSEEGIIKLQTNKDGALQTVAEFSYSDIVIGTDNSNLNGIVIGEQNVNNGENVVIGYSVEATGANIVGIGNNNTITSTNGAGSIGINHIVSGENIWVFGGSGINAQVDDQTILAVDNDNYVSIKPSGDINLHGLSSNGVNVNITNSKVVSTTNTDNLSFVFYNAAGQAKSGIVISNDIVNSTNGSENTSLEISNLIDGSSQNIVSISADNMNIGDNSILENNTVFGINNTITDSGNIVLGNDIVITGVNNFVVGANNLLVDATGNIVVCGLSNTVESSGNHDLVVLGNSNTVDEDYSITIGISLANSGLYSTVLGFDSGTSASYVTSIGANNLVTNDASATFGNNNTVNGEDINSQGFALGVGNTVSVAGTGIAVGLDNTLKGTSATVMGLNNSVSGVNNIVVGTNNTIDGDNIIVIGSGNNYSVDNSFYISNGQAAISATGSNVNVTGSLSINNTGLNTVINEVILDSVIGSGSVTVSIDGNNVVVSGETINDSTITVTGIGNLTGGGAFTLNQASPQTVNISFDNTQDLDMQGNRVLFGNLYNDQADLPAAASYHGMFAHAHNQGAAYFAHAGNWVELSNAGHTHTASDVTDFQNAVTGITDALYEPLGGGSSSSITDGTSTLNFDGSNNLQVDTNLLPTDSGLYDLGSTGKPWKDLYLEGTSIYLGNSVISSTGNGDLVLNNVSMSGHIIPASNSNFDLGSAERKIRHLYLSSNSMYMDDNRVSFTGTNMYVNDSHIANTTKVGTGVGEVLNNEITFVINTSSYIQGPERLIPETLTIIYNDTLGIGSDVNSNALKLNSVAVPTGTANGSYFNIPIQSGDLLSDASVVDIIMNTPAGNGVQVTGILFGHII